ncbi:MAG: response regulator [Planctomycetes bacterium]|nr:response regulator [Planctomycetota bacterium]
MPRFLPRSIAWQAVLVSSAAAALPAQALLLQCPPDAVAYATRHWHLGNGLPQNSVNALLQTLDGHVWVGTFGGLCRLDGERIAVFDVVAGLPSSRVRCLCETRDGTLWIGLDVGGLVSHRDGRFTQHPELPASYVQTLLESAPGELAIATPDAVWRHRGNTFERWPGPPRARVEAFLRRRSGELLAGGETGVWRLDATGSLPLTTSGVNCLAEVGSRLLLGRSTGLFCLAAGEERPWQPVKGTDTLVHALLVAEDGALWVGTDAGAVRIAPELVPDADAAWPNGGEARPPASPDAMYAARTLMADREGGVWVGGDQRGVTRHSRVAAREFGREHGLPHRGVQSILDAGDGAVLVGTSTGVRRGDGNQFTRMEPTVAAGGVNVLARDPDEVVWLVSPMGIHRIDATGHQLWVDARAWPAHRVRAMVRTPAGDHWLGGDGGLALLRDRTLSCPPEAEAFRGQLVRALAIGPDGALWVGAEYDLARIGTDGRVRNWHTGTSLPPGTIRAIVPEAGDAAWIATYGSGLVRIDGDRCTTIDERHGLHDQHLSSLLVHDDVFVFGCNHGVFTVARDQIAAVLAGRATTLGSRVLDAPGDAAAEISGGMQNCMTQIGTTLWFCGIDRLVAYDLASPPRRQATPTAKADDVYLGDRRIVPTGTIVAPAGARNLTFRLGAATFDHPERLRFRWRLGDADAAWIGPTFERDVHLVDLGPGEHRFEAEVVGVDGSASPRRLQWHIHVPPAWWETTLARVLSALAGLAAATLLVRYGASRSAARTARLQMLVDLRTRDLDAARHQLEQRVAERTAELQVALHRQQEAMAARQALEGQLRQTQRMESLGQLAGGVAHDFNNLLTVILGSADLIAALDSPEERAELTHAIRSACRRGSNLTQHLLAVASRQSVELARLDLGRVVGDLLPVLRSLLGDGIALHFAPPTRPLQVRAAVTQIEQILLNLASNARDAMARGGTVTIRIDTAAQRVVLEFADTGQGMPPEVLERVFEPFYSTKTQGVGRGLGLATVYGIVKQLDGAVHIDSAVERGTTVRIDLPEDVSGPTEPIVELPQAGQPHLQARVLLIEDEPLVCTVLERMLRGFGCSVRTAPDGATGVDLLRTAPEAVDVVLSDVVMPGLHGRALCQALLAIRADLPIVFLSGYLDGRLTHQDLAEMGLDILPKPIDPGRLARALKQAIERRRPVAPRDPAV